ncbi:hypothetical protein [Sphingomonas yantingensis]|uniref:Sugar lactone lactonase YvrE n=1 Tax=Sphingomonas yantingensis TaxID=1241761 RepID=A0A7W9EJM1_9SPHN|nr:hypothetical protein [Sphingomonas yantingensis]MBB5699195.1 sugar lactone lactonase YvrE [Sphingomonas yantingensis]
MVDGEVLMNRPASGPATPVAIAIASDAIALSPDGSKLYYRPLSGRTLHAVPTANAPFPVSPSFSGLLTTV